MGKMGERRESRGDGEDGGEAGEITYHSFPTFPIFLTVPAFLMYYGKTATYFKLRTTTYGVSAVMHERSD
jgi:hypothetical protein